MMKISRHRKKKGRRRKIGDEEEENRGGEVICWRKGKRKKMKEEDSPVKSPELGKMNGGTSEERRRNEEHEALKMMRMIGPSQLSVPSPQIEKKKKEEKERKRVTDQRENRRKIFAGEGYEPPEMNLPVEKKTIGKAAREAIGDLPEMGEMLGTLGSGVASRFRGEGREGKEEGFVRGPRERGTERGKTRERAGNT